MEERNRCALLIGVCGTIAVFAVLFFVVGARDVVDSVRLAAPSLVIALLVPTTGVTASAITAAMLVFRGAIYWMPVLIGGLSVSVFGVQALE